MCVRVFFLYRISEMFRKVFGLQQNFDYPSLRLTVILCCDYFFIFWCNFVMKEISSICETNEIIHFSLEVEKMKIFFDFNPFHGRFDRPRG